MQDKKNVLTIFTYICFMIITIYLAFNTLMVFDQINAAYTILIAVGIALIAAAVFAIYKKHQMGKKAQKILTIIISLLLFLGIIAKQLYNYLYSDNTNVLNIILIVIGFILAYAVLKICINAVAAITCLIFGIYVPVIDSFLYYDGYGLLAFDTILLIVLLFEIYRRYIYAKDEIPKWIKYAFVIHIGLIGNLLIFTNDYSFIIVLIVLLFLLFKYCNEAFLYIMASAPLIIIKADHYYNVILDGEFAPLLGKEFNFYLVRLHDDVSNYTIMNSPFRTVFALYLILSVGAAFLLFYKKRTSLQLMMSYMTLIILISFSNLLAIDDIMITIALGSIIMSAAFIGLLLSMFVNKAEDEVLSGDVVGDPVMQEIHTLEDCIPKPAYGVTPYGDESGCIIVNGNKYTVRPEIIEAYDKRRQKAHNKYKK